MTRLEALVALNMAGSIGSVRLKKLLEYFVSPQDIFNAPVEKLVSVSGIGENLAARIHSFRKEALEKELKLARKLALKIITAEDEDYPVNLKNIPGLPIVLYVKGEIKPLDNHAVAVVGSRNASLYGLAAAAKFSTELAESGFTIVSGLARGVDTSAHRAALKAGGRTLAIMGSGFNNIYPAENKEFCEEIARSGAVISEFPLDEKPLKENFPRRNRVISGLSLGVLVAEAARNSGALITADFALEQGREVFALPGKIDSENSSGTNELIKQGAKLVTQASDILEELVPGAPLRRENKTSVKCDLNNEKENRLYGLMTPKALTLDELIEKSSMGISEVSGILLSLQLKKLIKQLPGKQFARNS